MFKILVLNTLLGQAYSITAFYIQLLLLQQRIQKILKDHRRPQLSIVPRKSDIYICKYYAMYFLKYIIIKQKPVCPMYNLPPLIFALCAKSAFGLGSQITILLAKLTFDYFQFLLSFYATRMFTQITRKQFSTYTCIILLHNNAIYETIKILVVSAYSNIFSVIIHCK